MTSDPSFRPWLEDRRGSDGAVHSFCLSYSCPMLNPFYGFRCHFGRYICTIIWHILLDRVPIDDPHGKGRFGVDLRQTPSQNMQLQIDAKPSVLCCHLANRLRLQTTSLVDLPQGFRFLPDYFGRCRRVRRLHCQLLHTYWIILHRLRCVCVECQLITPDRQRIDLSALVTWTNCW